MFVICSVGFEVNVLSCGCRICLMWCNVGSEWWVMVWNMFCDRLCWVMMVGKCGGLVKISVVDRYSIGSFSIVDDFGGLGRMFRMLNISSSVSVVWFLNYVIIWVMEMCFLFGVCVSCLIRMDSGS